MITPLKTSEEIFVVQKTHPACEWLNKICTTVQNVVTRILKTICGLFGGQEVSGSASPLRKRWQGPLNLIAFYKGTERNNRGVTLEQILGWNHQRLEEKHDYIQWLFPLKTPSGPNPSAATLDNATIQIFKNDPTLKGQLLRSFRKMLSFYGLRMNEETKRITRGANFSARASVWLTPSNHNFLRISRILGSLSLLGLQEYSQSFLRIMQDIASKEGRGITDQSTRFWERACQQG